MAELADLLTDRAARRALAQRDMSAVFRILRDAGVSQVRLARATGQPQSAISEIIAGRQVQSVGLLERIADGLEIPRGWMGLAHEPDLVAEPATPDEVETEDDRRNNLLRHGANVLYGKSVFGPVAPIRAAYAATPVPSRVGLSEVEQVAATTNRLGQLTGDLGGIPMTSALTAHARASEALLGATMGEPVRPQLLSALADAHRVAAGAASDAGLPDLARQHLIRGMDCAGAAGDVLRIVLSLDNLGCRELDGEPNEALKLFQLGAAGAPSRLSRALVEYHCALAFGLLGLPGEALAALRRARYTHEAASDEPGPWKHFATALPHVEGRTHFALGRFDRAAGAFATLGDGPSHTVACTVGHYSYLAAAQLQCGELRSGLLTATRAVGLAKGLRSISVWDDLAPLQQAAAARHDSACQDLARELATLRSAA